MYELDSFRVFEHRLPAGSKFINAASTDVHELIVVLLDSDSQFIIQVGEILDSTRAFSFSNVLTSSSISYAYPETLAKTSDKNLFFFGK